MVAFQCAIAIINAMTPGEASLLMCCAIGPRKNAVNLPNEKRIQPILIDLLRYRLISARLLKLSATNSKIDYYKASHVHERLSRESIALDTFPVDEDDLGLTKVNQSAWKIGNAILMLRMGSKKDSSYRGWVEVVLRTPCSRIRRLVKWKKDCISEYPSSFLPYYDQLCPESRRKELKLDKNDSPPEYAESKESIAIMSRADSIIARFDSLIESSAEQNEDEIYSGTKTTPSSSPTTTQLQRRTPRRVDSSLCFSLKRTLSDGDLLPKLPQQIIAPQENKGSVYAWLQDATGRNDIDDDVIHELELLGFSRQALGMPDTTTASDSYPDLFAHEKMEPYNIGPTFNRALSILERVAPFQTHRIALFYGGTFSTSTTRKSSRSNTTTKSDTNTNNDDGEKIISSTQASPDFWEFARDLGDLVPIRHLKYYAGGLDTASETDGTHAFVWFGCQGGSYELNDPILVDSMCVFHTVILMPNRLNNRKRHVGNDICNIVFGLDIDTLDVDHEKMAISGQFGFITIYVIPLAHIPLFKVSVHLKAGLEGSLQEHLQCLVGSWLVHKKIGGHFVRKLAMQADCQIQSMIEDKLGLVLNLEDRAGRIRDTERHLKKSTP